MKGLILIVLICFALVCQGQSIDSLRYAIFRLHQDNIQLHDELFILKDTVQTMSKNIKVDNLITNRAGLHIMEGGAAVIGSLLVAGGASILYASGDKPLGWILYGVSAGVLTFGGYQFYFAGKKLGWVGKGYYIVQNE